MSQVEAWRRWRSKVGDDQYNAYRRNMHTARLAIIGPRPRYRAWKTTQLEDVIARRARGESWLDIGKIYKAAEGTVRAAAGRYSRMKAATT